MSWECFSLHIDEGFTQFQDSTFTGCALMGVGSCRQAQVQKTKQTALAKSLLCTGCYFPNTPTKHLAEG